MIYILIWMSMVSGQSVSHYQLGTYDTKEECVKAMSKAAVIVTHQKETVACLEGETQR